MISTKQILLELAPGALRIVSRPSASVTVDEPSSHRAALVVVPLTVSTPSTAIANELPKYDGSPTTTRTESVPFLTGRW
ncbi:MAG: hypothetical protein AUH43_04085 [Acidobacteria bacterium 13_1_40CM_65_14]|nr:MAG: hypothetical protein AUH43_04085 [Acidobacteria bacterium 13_1_40CM_65_14]